MNLCNMLDYHKFLHDDVFYRFNGENITVIVIIQMKLGSKYDLLDTPAI